jgi:hypothetical protein
MSMSEQTPNYFLTKHRVEPEDSIRLFNSLFPTEEKCLEELFSICGISLDQCQRCLANDVQKLKGGRSSLCLKCSKITWFCAKTALHSMKKAKPRLAIIWLAQRGLLLSSKQLSVYFGISQSSAHEITLWFSQLIDAELRESNCEFVHSEEFRLVICKRSRETPAREHPRKEIESAQLAADEIKTNEQSASELEQERAGAETEFPISDSEGSSISKHLLAHLSDTPVSFDYLARNFEDIGALSAALQLLELQGKVKIIHNNYFVLAKEQPSFHSELASATQAAIEQSIRFLVSSFHGISRRYLQLYISIYYFASEQKTRLDSNFLKNALRKRLGINLREYVSPLVVALPQLNISN